MQSYFITSPSLYENNSVLGFSENLKNISSSYHIDKACFRDTMIFSNDLIDIFAKWCKKNKIQSFINLKNTETSIELAKIYNIQGIHIKGTNLHTIKKALDEKLSVFYSSHCANEAQKAIDAGVNFITLSPIFNTPNKGKPLGIEYLQGLSPIIKNSLFALGGIICQDQVSQIESTGVKGFASIRYFQNIKNAKR